MAVVLNVLGTNGNDTLKSTAAVEMIAGGLGLDKLTFEQGKQGVSVNLATGVMTDSFGNKETVSGIEIVIGTAFNDKITGTEQTDYLAGGAGNDSLYGSGGSDELYGVDGDDYLSGGNASDYIVGGAGNDLINGGAGFDMVDYSDEGGAFAITVDLVAKTATDTYGDKDTFSSIERIRASDLADTLMGNNSANMFEGNGGNDTMDGLGGNDVLRGGFGDDKILGGSGADMIAGGRGADYMDGGTGSLDMADYANDGGWHGVAVNLQTGLAEDSWGDTDKLVSIEGATGTDFDDWFMGRTGANTFTGAGGNDTMAGGGGNDAFVFAANHGHDRINDFNTGDKISLIGLGFATVDDVVARATGHELGVLIRTGDDSSIVLVDVNITSVAALGYIFA